MTTQHYDLEYVAAKAIELAKKNGANSAEVNVNSERGFSVTARMRNVETLEHHQGKNLNITVYKDHCVGLASTSDFSEQALQEAAKKASTIASYTQKDLCSGLAEAELMAYDYHDLGLYHHWDLSPDDAINIALDCEEQALQDTRIKSSEGAAVSTYDSENIYINTHGFVGSSASSMHNISCSLIAEKDGVMHRDYEFSCARKSDDLMPVSAIASNVVDKTVKRLGARRLKTQQSPIIFHPSVAKKLIGHFLSAISGSSLYRESSFLLDHLGRTIFPEFMNIYQDPAIIGGYGSTAFDNQGVKTARRHYVEEGVLSSYVLGCYSARKLGLDTTGNAGGVFNLFVSSSELTLTDLLRDMGTGLLVTELMGQGVNILTGDYSRGAFGYWVENGVIEYPVHEITIASNLKDMFANIVAVGNDVDNRTNVKTGSIWVDEMTIAGE